MLLQDRRQVLCPNLLRDKCDIDGDRFYWHMEEKNLARNKR